MELPPYDNTRILKDVTISDPEFLKHLRFGDGTLLRDGTFGHHSGRSLKGRYIVRVGWDDVRGFLPQVWFPFAPARKERSLTPYTIGWNSDRDSKVQGLPYS